MLSPNARIDTHVHSRISDGTGAPARVMREARAAGLDVIGLSDHDTIEGWAEAEAAVKTTGVGLIRGMEVTTRHEGVSVHMLAYLFDPRHDVVRAYAAHTLLARRARTEEIVERIAKDYPITMEEVLAKSDGVSIGRPHIADVLVDKGIVANRNEAFATILASSSKYYIPHRAIATVDAIEWIVRAGGKAVCAHPRAVGRGQAVPRDAFDQFAEAGLFGIEVWHRDNPESERPFLVETAARLGLRMFGSSDYHGTGKPNRLGENTTDPETVEALADGAALEILLP